MADAPTKPRKKRKATAIREQQFIANYTDADRDTYLNATKSIENAPGYNSTTKASAHAMGTEVLHRPSVVQGIKEQLAQQGMDDSVRATMTASIAQGYTETITTTTETEGRPPVTSTVRKPVAARTRLLALDRLDRIDGSADRRRVEADVLSTELRALSKRMLGEKAVSHGVSKSIHSGAGARDRARGEDAPQSPSIPSPLSEPDTKSLGGSDG